MGLRVLSLFDGISCGRLALERAGINVDTYYASEIDKFAIKIAQKNYPSTIQIGNVEDLDFDRYLDVGLLIGGSPCTDLSVGKRDRKGLDGTKSRLFWEYIRAFDRVHPKYFLYENVASMKQSDKDIISECLGVEPILINSSLLSGQKRSRYYWTNILGIETPKDKNILLKDCLLSSSKTISLKLSEKELAYMDRKVKGGRTHWDFGYHSDVKNEKSQCLIANLHKGVPYNVVIDNDGIKRKFHPIECERLQTLPDNYTEGVSLSQRYKMIGNGWTVDVVAHIFKGLKNT